MTFYLSTRSMNNLKGVHTDLIKVVLDAIQISTVDFVVIEGLRTKERQKMLFDTGKSKTMNSKHLTGHAVDLAALVNGAITWDAAPYKEIADAMLKSATKLGVNVTWGGSWRNFNDSPHFQIEV